MLCAPVASNPASMRRRSRPSASVTMTSHDEGLSSVNDSVDDSRDGFGYSVMLCAFIASRAMLAGPEYVKRSTVPSDGIPSSAVYGNPSDHVCCTSSLIGPLYINPVGFGRDSDGV